MPRRAPTASRAGAQPRLAKLEVVVGNALPVVGVVALGWSAFTVVALYVLDGWFCILGLGASVVVKMRPELRSLIPNGYGPVRRLLVWVVSVTLIEAFASVFALLPGIGALMHMDRAFGTAVAEAFGRSGFWVPVALLAASHGARVARGVRGEGEGVMALAPTLQMAVYTVRMFLMLWLAWLASPGVLSRVLVPAYVAGVGALFTWSDLDPTRFLARVARAAGGARRPREGSDS